MLFGRGGCASIRGNLTMPDTDMTPADVLREPQNDQKNEVRAFWNSDPCGTRYLEGKDQFEAHARARYALEPFIFDFAQFQSARGLKVLEIGVGMGADYLEW